MSKMDTYRESVNPLIQKLDFPSYPGSSSVPYVCLSVYPQHPEKLAVQVMHTAELKVSNLLLYTPQHGSLPISCSYVIAQ